MRHLGAYHGTVVNPETDKKHKLFCGFIGRQPDFVMDFAPDASLDAMANPSIPEGWRGLNYDKLILTMPLIPKGGTLEQAANGEYDAKYTWLMVYYMRAGFRDCIIRLGHEFNGTWYTWRADNGKAELFKAAWRRVVDKIRSNTFLGGGSYRFDWCPTRGKPSDVVLEKCYPGDEYVDVIGLDVYNQSWIANYTDPIARWNDIRYGEYGLDWHRDFAYACGKPISFPEWGTGNRPDGHGGGDDPIFVRNMAAWINSNNVLYHGYWDYKAADMDCRISDNTFPNAAKAYRTAFRT